MNPEDKPLVSAEEIKRLTALFVDTPLLWVPPNSPEIPQCLRQSVDPKTLAPTTEPVLTVRCGPRAEALVMTNGGMNAIVPRNPTLRSTLRTLWNERWVFWVRLTGPIPEGSLCWKMLRRRAVMRTWLGLS